MRCLSKEMISVLVPLAGLNISLELIIMKKNESTAKKTNAEHKEHIYH